MGAKLNRRGRLHAQVLATGLAGRLYAYTWVKLRSDTCGNFRHCAVVQMRNMLDPHLLDPLSSVPPDPSPAVRAI